MKNRFVSLLIITLVATSGVSQNTADTTYNQSIGLEFQHGDLSSIGLTYRKFYKKFNFKMGVFLGTSTFNDYNGNEFFYETGDTTNPIIGVNPLSFAQRSAQTLQLGLEKRIPYSGVDFVLGADVFVGHRIVKEYSQVNKVQLEEFTYNELEYFRYNYPEYNFGFNSDYNNQLESKYNFLVYGVNINLGVAFDLGTRIEIIGMVTYQIQGFSLLSESFTYSSEEYKIHLPSKPGVNQFNTEFMPSVSATYKF